MPSKPSWLVAAVFLTIPCWAQNGPEVDPLFWGQPAPGNEPKIFAPGIVTVTAFNHSSVSMSPDGREIFWARSFEEGSPRQRIFFARRTGTSWGEPKAVHFTKEFPGDVPMVSPDGDHLYFTSRRPDNRKENIWVAERRLNGWSKPTALGPMVNSEHLHWQVSVDRQGNLYFGSERDGGKGQDDIFVSRFHDGIHQQPVSLGEAINTGLSETTPFVDPDGRYLIFSRPDYRNQDMRTDLFISFRSSDGAWAEAQNLSTRINSARMNEGCPYVSPDGRFLFFLRVGPRMSEVYWVDAHFIKELSRFQ